MSHILGKSRRLCEVSNQLRSNPTSTPCLRLFAGPIFKILSVSEHPLQEFAGSSNREACHGLLVSAAAKLFPAQPYVSSRGPAHQTVLDFLTVPGLRAAYAQPSRCSPPLYLSKKALLEDQIIQLKPDHVHSSSASCHSTRGVCRQP